MKALFKIWLPLGSATLGYFIGMPGLATREGGRLPGDSGVPGTGPAAAAHASKADPIAPVLGALLSSGDLRGLARLAPLLAGLDPAQMRMLFDALDRLPAAQREPLIQPLFADWLKRDPQAASAWMKPHLERYAKSHIFGGGIQNCDADLVQAWAEKQPELALEFARQCPRTELGEMLLRIAIRQQPEKNPAAGFELIRGFPESKAREKVLVSFLFTWAQKDRAGALSAAAALPAGSERDRGQAEVLAGWAAKEPATAFEQARISGVTNPALLAIMAQEAAKSDPLATVRWLEAQDGGLFPQLAGVVAKFWAKREPAAALDWAQAHGVSLLDPRYAGVVSLDPEFSSNHSYEMIGAPFTEALREKPDATLAWVQTLPPGPERERFLEMAILHGVAIEKAKPLLAELPPDAAGRGAAQIASILAVTNLAQAQQWAESLPLGSMREEAWAALGRNRAEALPLPPGPDRDAMLRGMASTRATIAPVAALERALEIGDPALRRRTFDDVFWQLNHPPNDLGDGPRGGISMPPKGPSESILSAARAWLEAAQVPAEWKQQWRQ